MRPAEPRFTQSPAGDVYDVFARIRPEDTLRHIGNVIAPDAGLAQVYAFTMYQEWSWCEMFIVPRQAVVPLIEAA